MTLVMAVHLNDRQQKMAFVLAACLSNRQH
jgi:hypothetical protein